MQGISLKSRAIALAYCGAAVALILSIMSSSGLGAFAQITLLVIVCGGLTWASKAQTLEDINQAVENVKCRVIAASEGDLCSPMPRNVGASLPELANALDGMFAQVKSELANATTLALFDPVTSLANRTHFRHEAESVLRSRSTDGIVALAFIDLDNFKSVNDTFGHASGDYVLSKIANRLRAVVSAEVLRRTVTDDEAIIARLAGDEFTILFPHVDDQAGAARLGSLLLDALAKPIEIDGFRITVGASIGIALTPNHGTTLAQLMRAADVAMYHAKANGRGQFQFYTEALTERMAQRTQLESELRTAIARDEFTLVFQPQMALASGEIQAVEGLLRWIHPTDGLRYPGSFLACAEESGLIAEIGNWSILALAKHAARWGHDSLAPRMAVNLSPRQVARPNFFQRLNDAFVQYNAPLSVIEFEVSEAVLMDCGPAMVEQLVSLRQRGARIAIDDFGSGLSSLSRLRSLPFDTVKLDTTLVAGIEHDAAARDIVQAVIGLVHSLGAQAVAEGVETLGQLDVLRVMGCDAAQGYAIAPPMTEEDCRAWLSNTRPRIAA